MKGSPERPSEQGTAAPATDRDTPACCGEERPAGNGSASNGPALGCTPQRGPFAAIGRFAYRFRWFVLGVWCVAFVLGLVATFYLGDVLKGGGFEDEGSASQQAAALVEERLGTGFTTMQIVFSSRPSNDGGAGASDAALTADDPAFAQAMEAALADITPGSIPELTQVIALTPDGTPQLVSDDGTTAVAVLVFDAPKYQVQQHVDEVRAALNKTALQADVTGEPAANSDIAEASVRDLQVAETYAIPIALIALVFVFGTLVAAAMPIVGGGMAVTVSLGVLYLLANAFDVSIYAMNVLSLLGLAVGIDYALFIVARFREELSNGTSVEQAVQATVCHAGRSVFYSGLAVAIGVLGLVFFPFAALQTVGMAGALVVALSVLSAVTLLPALLGILGHRIDRFRIVRVHPQGGPFWKRWAGWVTRRPIVFTVLAVALIAVIAWPVSIMRTEMPTATTLPAEAESRRGYEALVKGFDLGELSPNSVALTWEGGGSAFDAERLVTLSNFARQLEAVPGVSKVTSIVTLPGMEGPLPTVFFGQAAEPALETGEAVSLAGIEISAEEIAQLKQLVDITVGDGIVVYQVATEAPPSSAAASEVVERLRELQPPQGMQLSIAGESATRTDFFSGLYDRFPWVIGAVVAVTFVILVLLSRSILVPVIGALTNLATILMAWGIIVFIFQDGRWQSILGYTSTGTVDAIIPILIFCILFGVSMDYEVFLVARMHETWERTRDPDAAVAAGLTCSGRVIVSAAALVVVIAGSFTFTSISITKQLGLGVAFAILFDALFIRMMLVPASTRLLGRWAWWIPPWLDRVLPRLHFD
jgi:RND superfamily putative drug exporter